MPTYVYKFLDSGETIEVQQPFTDNALTEAPHPSDGSLRPVRKVFTPVGITFKGDGFYKTDSRGKSTSTSASSSSSSSSEGASGDSSSTTSTGTPAKASSTSGDGAGSSGANGANGHTHSHG